MDHPYSLLHYISLDAGSWADWFAGTMSALAVITALAAYPVTQRQRRQEQRQRDRELGRSVGWKTLAVLNQTGDIARHIKNGLEDQEYLLRPGKKFPFVRPLGIPSRLPTELNQNEIDFLLKAKAADLLAEIEMCMGRYSSIVYAMNEYKNRHESLYELMPSPVAGDGTRFTLRLTLEENARVAPYANMLEALLSGIIDLVDENMRRAKAALGMYDEAMEKYFGKALLVFTDVETPDG